MVYLLGTIIEFSSQMPYRYKKKLILMVVCVASMALNIKI